MARRAAAFVVSDGWEAYLGFLERSADVSAGIRIATVEDAEHAGS